MKNQKIKSNPKSNSKSNLSSKCLFLITVAICAAVCFGLLLSNNTIKDKASNINLNLSTKQAEAAGWYDSNWNYRREITLAPVTPEANYQIKVTLTNESLTGAQLTGADANGNDIRFTGSDGTTLQKYWIESWSADERTVTATIWVNVANSGVSTIYMYYGNSSASSASNGTNTFEFFDDFEGDTPYTSIFNLFKGKPWTKYSGNPILEKSASGWDSYRVRDPVLLIDTSGYLVQEDNK